MAPIITREEVFSRIADASLFGHLGFFVGSGFSKALTIGDDHPHAWQRALNFRELLERLAQSLGLPLDVNSADVLRGKSYPQLASALLASFLTERGIADRTVGTSEFRKQIAAICNFAPLPAVLEEYRKALRRDMQDGLAPSWFITTNYDFLIEMVIDGAPLLPNEAFTPRADQVPVYHLHGHRLQPDSIVITEEDYVQLMGPVAYRQWKLGLLLAESTTVMLGYAYGDINVKVAHKLSQAFREENGLVQKPHQGFVVQALFEVDKASLRPDPYEAPDGELVIEIGDILTFLKEASEARRSKVAALDAVSENLKHALSGASDDVLSSDSDARKIFIQYLKAHPHSYRASEIMGVFKRLLDPLWSRAREDGGWEFYDKFLSFLLDVLEAVQIDEIHPTIARYLLDNVVRIAGYLAPPDRAPVRGEPRDASRTWARRRDALPERTRRELSSMAQLRELPKAIEVLRF